MGRIDAIFQYRIIFVYFLLFTFGLWRFQRRPIDTITHYQLCIVLIAELILRATL